jgi:hypothetical protein
MVSSGPRILSPATAFLPDLSALGSVESAIQIGAALLEFWTNKKLWQEHARGYKLHSLIVTAKAPITNMARIIN